MFFPHKKTPLIVVTRNRVTSRIPFFFIRFYLRFLGADVVYSEPKNKNLSLQPDAVVLAGGTDINPALYQEQRKVKYDYDDVRDEIELHWARYADEKGIPILGICRGAQLLNIHRGGDLHFEIAKAFEKANYPSSLLAKIFYRKPICLDNDSFLANIFGTSRIKVNSLHTQSIRRVGKGLMVTAKEENKIVQAVEDKDHVFFIGLQFHPELMLYRKEMRLIFFELFKYAKKSSGNS